MRTPRGSGALPILLLSFCAHAASLAPVDPGPRGGPPAAGGPLPGLVADETAFFENGQVRFAEIETVSGGPNNGLGPRFNSNQCLSCHSQPAGGGTSPAPNPLIGIATLDGATNTVPWFIDKNGPIREARFKRNPDGSTDGNVHAIYVISGRADAPGCQIAQPDFLPAGNPLTGQGGNRNVIFRIPTPFFGGGLIESIRDATILGNMTADRSAKIALGIAGHPNSVLSGNVNRSANDGTITRFGWKAQNKSLLIFAGEAYNVEQGVTNEAFPNERNTTTGCVFNATPEDASVILNGDKTSSNFGTTIGTVSEMSSDVVNFAAFMSLLGPPIPATATSSTTNGSALFSSIGCALCHSASLTTAASPFTGMSNVTYHPYSDFALHHMGAALADGINQGGAGPDQFRTAPLWGLGQRLFFLHDGRTADLMQTIQDHYYSSSKYCAQSATAQLFYVLTTNSVFEPETSSTSCNSEANTVINNFNSLSSSQQQDLLNFLRSL
jgi:CxxC motif-containing protein (DUF1111 family)